mgnify:CR=1 FL=1
MTAKRIASPKTVLYNRQKATAVPLPWLRRAVKAAVPGCLAQGKEREDAVLATLEEVEITFVDDAEIARVHGEFLDDPTPTDVITFHHGEILISADTAFLPVIHACATAPRPGQDGTWIVPEMIAAYTRLHRLGIAHSVEVWDGEVLIGGLYGLAIGRMYFGESMFSAVPDASKAALWALCTRLAGWGWPLIDCQQETPHLVSLGATSMPREEFVAVVTELARSSEPLPGWRSESLPL